MSKSLPTCNRGERAFRVIRTAREMDIRTLAVYSDADTAALEIISSLAGEILLASGDSL